MSTQRWPNHRRTARRAAEPIGLIRATAAMIVFYGVDMDAMATFLGAPEFVARMAKFVSGHTLYSLSELPPPA